jgi:hypothetical protein
MATGGTGGDDPSSIPGGNGFGGGVYVAGGTVSLTGATLSGNTARGGPRSDYSSGPGGNGFGGAVYVAAGTVSLWTVTVASNTAQGSYPGGAGYGGGICIAAGGTMYLDAFTQSNTGNNTADFYSDIEGSYTLQISPTP